MRKIVFCFLGMLYVLCLSAAGNDVKVKIRSRALLDATLSGYGTDHTQAYYRLEDFRFGAKASFGNFDLKADLAYGNNKVSLKDLLLTYSLPNSLLIVGNTYEPFSMDMLISTADLRFHQSAASVLAFTNSRKLGVTYHYYLPEWYAATGVYTHNDINKIGTEQQLNSWISTSRVAKRFFNHSSTDLFHVGAAFSFRSKDAGNDNSQRTVKSDGVTAMLGEPLLEVELENITIEWKSVFELLYANSSLLLQEEYFVDCFNRQDNQGKYCFHGGYIQASYLIIGKNGFLYDMQQAIPGRPLCDRAVELTARVNYTDMTSGNYAESRGGREWDLSLGINYYINQHIGIKWSNSFVFTGGLHNSFYRQNMFISQLRCQYIF